MKRATWIPRLLAATLTLWLASAAAHEKADEALPPPPVRLRIVAPSTAGPWLVRIDNEGDEPVRIAADARLLSFTVKVPGQAKWQRDVVCDGPTAFNLSGSFPQDRELLLEPGHSYVQQFDPRMICFGKQASVLRPGATVRAALGWPPKPKWSRRMAAAPFVADATKRPRKFRPLRRLTAPTMVLSSSPPVEFGPKLVDVPPSAGRSTEDRARPAGGTESAEQASRYRTRALRAPKKPTPRDELGAALAVTTERYADANWRRDVYVEVEAHNVGERPLYLALRARQLSFRVDGPDGVMECPRLSAGHRVARDLYRQLHHGKHVHMRVRLAEVCPTEVFQRPGLYQVTPTLHVSSGGREYGLAAVAGPVSTQDAGKVGGTHHEDDDATIVRVRHGPLSFYGQPPRAIPTRLLPR